jgi:GNAT superfamily N-acetyltransferase
MLDASSYRADERTRAGLPLAIRAIRPDDKERLLENFSRLSERTVYYRFNEAKNQLTAADLRHLTEPDFDTHVALVAVAPDEEDGHERILGVGRYYVGTAPSGEPVAEVAFAVDDAYQGQGIGTHLLHHLGNVAMARGIDRFEAFVHPDNRRMLEVFENSGYGVQERADTDLVYVEMTLGVLTG